MSTNQNQSQEKKYYSFLSLFRCVAPAADGTAKPYIGFALVGNLKEAGELKTTTGNRQVLSGKMAIANQAKRISEMVGELDASMQGVMPTADQYGNVYAQVNFWGYAAERIAKLLANSNDGEPLKLVVTGKLSMVQNPDKQDPSKVWNNVKLDVNDFTLLPKAQKSNDATTAKQPATAPQQPAASGAGWGWGGASTAAPAAPAAAPEAASEFPPYEDGEPPYGADGFADLEGSEDNLPF